MLHFPTSCLHSHSHSKYVHMYSIWARCRGSSLLSTQLALRRRRPEFLITDETSAVSSGHLSKLNHLYGSPDGTSHLSPRINSRREGPTGAGCPVHPSAPEIFSSASRGASEVRRDGGGPPQSPTSISVMWYEPSCSP